MTDATIAAAVTDATAQIDAEAAAAAAAAAAAPPSAVVTPEPDADAVAAAAAAEAAKNKPDPAARRIANLTRKMGEEARLREAADRRAEAAEALLAATRAADPAAAPVPAPRTVPGPTDVEARAAQLLAEREANQARERLVATGVKQFGEQAWNDRAEVLAEFGATNNPGFMAALLEAENPTAIVAALTDDTAALEELMRKTPAALATHLGRMDAGFSKPAAKVISAAPVPAAKVAPGGGAPVVDIYDPKMSMKDFQAEMDKLLPVHMGGKRKVG